MDLSIGELQRLIRALDMYKGSGETTLPESILCHLLEEKLRKEIAYIMGSVLEEI